MSSTLPPQLETLPVGSVFKIELGPTSEEDWRDEFSGYFIGGKITFGNNSIDFGTTVTQGWMESAFQDQWEEAARRIVSGHDRTAFLTDVGAGGWGMHVSRLLMWRRGEKLYSTSEAILKDSFSVYSPYAGIKSLEALASDPERTFYVISLQAIKDFLSRHGTDAARQEELGRPCEQCGKEIERCNRCSQCLNCGGGIGDAELGYCAKCAPRSSLQAEATPAIETPAVSYRGSFTETDWLESGASGPEPMISFLRGNHLSERKLFLAGCAWARRFWERLGRRSWTAIEVYERVADGEAPEGSEQAAWSRFQEGFLKEGDYFAFNDVRESEMDFFTALIQARAAWQRALPYMEGDPEAEAAIVLPARGVYSVGRGAYIDASDEFSFASGQRGAEYQAQCDIIRDIFGNPFRPVTLEASWLSQDGRAVAKLAQTIYEERAFELLPQFADMLEKSGCHNEQVLAHCRSEGEHARGCWVIDLLLGKDKLEFPLGARMPLLLQADIDNAPAGF